MVLVHLVIHFELPEVSGKKGRRSVLNSLKTKLKNRNLSVLDISDEYPKNADITVAYLAGDTVLAKKRIEEIEALLYTLNESMSFDIEYELL